MTDLAVLDHHLKAMPPVAAMQISARAFAGDVLTLGAPLAANVNDKNCAFGGSMASLMTLAGWGWLTLKLREAGIEAEVYVADSDIRYLAPLYDDLNGQARLREDQDWPAILRCLAERKRARVAMFAEMRNDAGVPVATLEARFALKIAGPSPAKEDRR
ncbi:MAG: YiiD C-terminal domain-containing protein [Arenimonas sp.]|nr:YiiD C-terminal domain-containing protein [Arenimonas sp.]